MPDHRYRFGSLEEDLSSYGELSELANSIEDGGFPMEEELENEILKKGARDPHYEQAGSDFDTEFVYFRYVAGTLTETVGLDDDGEDTDIPVQGRDLMDFLLLPDGRFIYESADNVGPGNATQLLICFATGEEDSNFEISDEGALATTIIERFYNGDFYPPDTDYRIRKIRVKGLSGDLNADSGLPEAVERSLQLCDDVSFNAGYNEDADLPDNPLISEFIRQGQLSLVNSDPASGNRRIMSSNNWFQFSYEDGLQSGQRSRTIFNRAKPVLDAAIPP